MNLRGWEKFSLVDYPGKICCIVFTGGCNLRCPFCHNPVLVFDPGSQPRVTEREFFHFLGKRRGLLEGVVISGGEPLLQEDIAGFVSDIRQLGFSVKVDTNGTLPEALAKLLEKGVDALGIDYKAPAEKYPALCGNPNISADSVRKSLALAVEKKVELDVRTTVHRALLSFEDLKLMREELDRIGVGLWTLQQYHQVEVIDDGLNRTASYTDRELVGFARTLRSTRVRGLNGMILNG